MHFYMLLIIHRGVTTEGLGLQPPHYEVGVASVFQPSEFEEI